MVLNVFAELPLSRVRTCSRPKGHPRPHRGSHSAPAPPTPAPDSHHAPLCLGGCVCSAHAPSGEPHTMCVAFCVWRLPLSITFSTLVQVVAGVRDSPSLFGAESQSPPRGLFPPLLQPRTLRGPHPASLRKHQGHVYLSVRPGWKEPQNGIVIVQIYINFYESTPPASVLELHGSPMCLASNSCFSRSAPPGQKGKSAHLGKK